MPHSVTLITTLAAALGLALVLGFLAVRLKLPPVVGYLLAGILIGPSTPGFVADATLSQQLAEIGVILLMFGVGIHFSLGDLLGVRRIALPGALAQIGLATLLGLAVTLVWGWSIGSGLVFGLALSVASTVVLLRALEDRRLLDSMNGRIAVGWLIVEDLAMVLVLVLLPALAGPVAGAAAEAAPGRSLPVQLLLTLSQIVAFIAIMLLVGARLFPWLLFQVARTGSRELFTLCVIAVAVGIAYGSTRFFGVSLALGAFFAGMVLRGSSLSYRAAEESLPLRDAFAVLFFVAVGMLFDPAVLLREPWRVLTVIAIITVGKSLAAFVIVLAFRYPLNTALTVSASLAQIGEFSFILAGLGVSLGLLPPEGQSLIVAGALITIAINPVVFQAIEPVQAWIRRRSHLARSLERRVDPLGELPVTVTPERLTGHVVLIGYGRVGRRIAETLRERGVTFVVADVNREAVERLRDAGLLAISGDASDPGVIVQTHVARARIMIIAIPDHVRVRKIMDLARQLNPLIEFVVRTHSDEEYAFLKQERLASVFMGEQQLAAAMSEHVLARLSAVQERTLGHSQVG
ncbi:MAG: YbaL family putative K(+) efflux transporter [Gemmatimonadales bacterium]